MILVVKNITKILKNATIFLGVFLIAMGWQIVTATTYSNQFINPALFFYGAGKRLTEEDKSALARYPLLVVDRFRYRSIAGNTWRELKSVNPDLTIMIYQMGPQVSKEADKRQAVGLNNIGRFKNSRSHSMGNILDDNPDWFLTNHLGVRLTEANNIYTDYKLDFGDPEFQKYWIEATESDVIGRPWVADGIMVDNCSVFRESVKRRIALQYPKQYSDADSWDLSMNKFVEVISKNLHEKKQLVMTNRGASHTETGRKAWIDLDSGAHPPDFLVEEGAFAVSWGSGDVQFQNLPGWIRQVELPQIINNSSIVFVSHTSLKPGQAGFSRSGSVVTFDQILRFSLGSYLLSKRETPPLTYFSFDYNHDAAPFRKMTWFDIFDKMNFGVARDSATRISSRNGNGTAFIREFDRGYVIVNPTGAPFTMHPTKNSIGSKWLVIEGGAILEKLVISEDFRPVIPPHDAAFILKIDD